MKTFTRINVDPNQMGGLPCIRSLRIPVATVVGMVGEGMAEAEILNAYPDLEVEDVREALPQAAHGLANNAPATSPLRSCSLATASSRGGKCTRTRARRGVPCERSRGRRTARPCGRSWT
jgi:uncharacterized protein (DUF433 family)